MKYDVVIIGGSAAGIMASLAIKNRYKDKSVLVIRKENKVVVPCAIPYIFHRLKSVDENVIPDKMLGEKGVNIKVDVVKDIDFESKKVIFEEDEVEYDKLIIATGSLPVKPPINGIDKRGVWFVKKDYDYLKRMREDINNARNIVIVGCGFIGLELAEEISNIEGKNISIIEKEEGCLVHALDRDYGKILEERVEKEGIKLYSNIGVKEIKGKEKVEKVLLEDGREIKADVVIVAIGARPNVELVKDKLEIGAYGSIKVNKYMETNIQDVYAIGDCAETRCFILKKPLPVMLASVATYEARICAHNLYSKDNKIKDEGTVSAFSTYFNGIALSMVGVNKRISEREGVEVYVGEGESIDKHPSSLENAEKIKVRLYFSKKDYVLIGGILMGSRNVAEMINLLSLAIQKRMNVYDIYNMQIATHPLLTSSPIAYPLIIAAQSVIEKISKR